VPKLATGEFIGAWGLTSFGWVGCGQRAHDGGAGQGWMGAERTKTFITNGHYADVLVVLAVTDRAAHTHGFRPSSWRKARRDSAPGRRK